MHGKPCAVNKIAKFTGFFAAIGGAIGVILLSMAAHKADNETAVRILHSGGLVLSLHMLAALIALSRNANFAAIVFILGGYLFAAAMSLLIFVPNIFIPGMAPAAGILLITGWLILAANEFLHKATKS